MTIFNFWSISYDISKKVSKNTDFQKGTTILDMLNSSEDHKAFHKMKTFIITTNDEHYQLPLLWKEECPVLPQSLKMAEKRALRWQRKDRKSHGKLFIKWACSKGGL